MEGGGYHGCKYDKEPSAESPELAAVLFLLRLEKVGQRVSPCYARTRPVNGSLLVTPDQRFSPCYARRRPELSFLCLAG